MTRAVWSFWAKPFFWRYRCRWLSDKEHLLAWVLSVLTAREHYPDTALHTDDAGARLLVDELGLPFEHLSLELNGLDDRDPRWWALGKLYTYRSQTEPFVHLDNDVFLWKRLPAAVENAQVFAQNPEYFSEGIFFYRPEAVDFAIKGLYDGWLPREWEWYRAFGQPQFGCCCGILGGSCVDFVQHYADLAIKMIEEPSNQPGWAAFDHAINANVQVEQYLLSACVQYHRHRPQSAFHKIKIGYLFDSHQAAYDRDISERVGYTHLMGDSKMNREISRRLEARVQAAYPDYYARCQRLVTPEGRLRDGP